MNWNEAYQQELERVRQERMDYAMDIFADDIWQAMGRENETRFVQAAVEGDQCELGRICDAAISKCLHQLVDQERIASACGQIDKANREAAARDRAQRLRDLKREATSIN